jgi:hypothetical protein
VSHSPPRLEIKGRLHQSRGSTMGPRRGAVAWCGWRACVGAGICRINLSHFAIDLDQARHGRWTTDVRSRSHPRRCRGRRRAALVTPERCVWAVSFCWRARWCNGGSRDAPAPHRGTPKVKVLAPQLARPPPPVIFPRTILSAHLLLAPASGARRAAVGRCFQPDQATRLERRGR